MLQFVSLRVSGAAEEDVGKRIRVRVPSGGIWRKIGFGVHMNFCMNLVKEGRVSGKPKCIDIDRK